MDTAKKIPLGNGLFALVDELQYEWFQYVKWYAIKDHNTYYVRRSVRVGNRKKIQLMHRVVMRLKNSKLQVDHINHNGLDNRKSNLRVCTNRENLCNQSLHRDSTTGFKGVYLHRRRFRAQIQVKGKKIHLGMFDTAEEAAAAYDAAAIRFYGEFAELNHRASNI